MTTNDEGDQAMRWLARTLTWEHRVDGIRAERVMRAADMAELERKEVDVHEVELQEVPAPAVEVRPAPRVDPIGLREPERTPFGAPRERVPRRDHRVA